MADGLDPRLAAGLEALLVPADRRANGESASAYHAFCHYRDMGSERSLKKSYNAHLHDCCGRMDSAAQANGTWVAWRKKWSWVERSRRYDDTLDQVGLEAQFTRARDRAARQMTIADSFMDKVVARLESLHPDELTPKELMQWADLAVKIQRGEPVKEAPKTSMPVGAVFKRASPVLSQSG